MCGGTIEATGNGVCSLAAGGGEEDEVPALAGAAARRGGGRWWDLAEPRRGGSGFGPH